MFLTLTKIVNEYGINRKCIEGAIFNDDLQAYKFNNKTKYVKKKDLEAWIERCKCNSIPLIKYSNFSKQFK